MVFSYHMLLIMNTSIYLKALKLKSNRKIEVSTIAKKFNLEIEETQDVFNVVQEADTLILEAIEFLTKKRSAGPDQLKTELKIGGNRANRIIDYIQEYNLLSLGLNSSNEESSTKSSELAERWARLRMLQEQKNKGTN